MQVPGVQQQLWILSDLLSEIETLIHFGWVTHPQTQRSSMLRTLQHYSPNLFYQSGWYHRRKIKQVLQQPDGGLQELMSNIHINHLKHCSALFRDSSVLDLA